MIKFLKYLAAIASVMVAVDSNGLHAQEEGATPLSEPLVARLEMKLTLGEKVIDTIEKGDLLTVLAERKDSYVIQTYNGHKGAVAKDNAVKLAESIDIYNELIAERKEEGRLYTLRASAWWALDEHEKSLADYDKAIELGYQVSHAYSSRGMFHASMGNFDKALADYSTAIEKDNKDDVAYLNRAGVLMTAGKVEDAIKDYTQAIALKPGSSILYQQRAVAHKITGKLSESVTDYDKAIELAPTDVAAWMGRGFVRFQLANHEQAAADFSKVIELAPQTAVAFNNRGYNLQLLGKMKEAIADYDQAIKLAPKYGLAYQNKAWLLALAEDASLKDGKSAIEAATMACDLSEYKNISDLTALAAALASDGQFEKAIGWQEKAIELANETQKSFAQKILALYQDEKPFDPKLAEASGSEEPTKTDEKTSAPKTSPAIK